MLDKFSYTNHLGEVVEFGAFPYFANHSDLRDYQWIYNTDITKFDRGTTTKTLKVVVVGTEEDANKAKNHLYEVFDKDVLAMKKGTFQVGKYKMNAFVYGSKKTNYLASKNVLIVDFDVVTDTPQWKFEKTLPTFMKAGNLEFEDWGRNYTNTRGYPYGYGYDQSDMTIYNESFYKCGFKMIIQGPVTNPAITIGDNLYRVDVTVGTNDHLEIISDGTTKTITLHKDGNVKVDCFAQRYKKQSVFTKIDSGINRVSWDMTFGFTLTLLMERSEPEWT